jgi:lysozyme family protein
MQVNQAKALTRVLVYEGGKVDDPRDPGGRTNQGVTQRVYNAYRQRQGQPIRDVYLITPGEVAAIYDGQYWDKIKGDDLPGGVDFVVFDGAVNSGPVQAVKWLQRALGIKADGIVGSVTVQTCREHPDHDRLIADICARRMAFLKALRTWATFGKGWTTRVANVKATGQALASGSVGPQPVFSAAGAARASIDDAKSVGGKTAAASLTGGGAVAAGLSQITEAVSPLADAIPSVRQVIAAVTAVGAVAAVGAGAYLWWARRREAEIADALDLPKAVPVPVNDNAAAPEALAA